MQEGQEAPGLMLWVQRKERTALNEEKREVLRAEFGQKAERAQNCHLVNSQDMHFPSEK